MGVRRAMAIVALGFGLILAACSSSSHDSASTTTTPGAATTTTKAVATTSTLPRSNEDAPALSFAHGWPADSGGSCDGHEPGKAGVLMTFCHGPSTITVKLADGDHVLKGVCWFDAGHLEVDAGTTVGGAFTGTWPDYATFQGPTTVGTGSASGVAWISGTQHLLDTASVTVTVDGLAADAPITAAILHDKTDLITATGHDVLNGQVETITATCG